MSELTKAQAAEQHAEMMKALAIQSQITAFQSNILMWQARIAQLSNRTTGGAQEINRAYESIQSLTDRIRECSEAICEINMKAQERAEYLCKPRPGSGAN